MNNVAPVLVTFTIFGISGLLLWKYLENAHNFKMAVLEKGISTEDYSKFFKSQPLFKMNHLRSLQFGLVSFFIGVGTMVGTIIKQTYFPFDFWWNIGSNKPMDSSFYIMRNYYNSIETAIMFASVVLFGGLGLILFYFIAARKEKKDEKK